MVLVLPLMAACSTNPATGEQQFAALMSPQQEVKVGAQEHQNVVKQFGIYDNPALTGYVNQVGQKVAQYTERPDVKYQFFVVDSPITNAFALPGGYIYVSRGLLSLANSEAELAAVLGHEAGHITGRHSAERYSTGVVTSLGAAVLAAALGNDSASQALGVGSDLLLKSYSRGQEHEADSLGIRYLARSGYDTKAMTWFLSNLQADSALQGKLAGRDSQGAGYFSTHPATSERIAKTVSEANRHQGQGRVNRDGYLKMIKGMPFGDSEAQGFVRGQDFYHTKMGFTFKVPDGFNLVNQPNAVVATSKSGAVVLFDMAGNKGGVDAATYLGQTWMKDQPINGIERVKIGGMNAASAGFQGRVNGQPMNIRLVAIEWKPDTIARFQIAMPANASQPLVEGLKRTTYSFRNLSASERQSIQPYKVRIVTAAVSDSVASLARKMPFDDYQEERFRVLNGLNPNEGVQPGRQYKIVSSR